MHTFRYEYGNMIFIAHCETKSTKNRNTDVCTMYMYFRYETAYAAKFIGKCVWYNRTWETYRYQTAIIDALRKMANEYLKYAKQDFCWEYGCKRIQGKRLQSIWDREKYKYPAFQDYCIVQSAIAHCEKEEM